MGVPMSDEMASWPHDHESDPLKPSTALLQLRSSCERGVDVYSVSAPGPQRGPEISSPPNESKQFIFSMSRPVTMIRDSIPVSGAVLDTHALSSLRSPDIASAFDSTETLEAVQFMLERGVSREYSLAKQRVSTLSKVTGAIQAILDLEPGLKPEDLGPENSVTYGIDAYRARRIMGESSCNEGVLPPEVPTCSEIAGVL